MLNVVVVGDWSNGAVSGEDPWSYLKRRLSRFVEEGSGGKRGTTLFFCTALLVRNAL